MSRITLVGNAKLMKEKGPEKSAITFVTAGLRTSRHL
jgi:hypothetical protein